MVFLSHLKTCAPITTIDYGYSELDARFILLSENECSAGRLILIQNAVQAFLWE